ncbi:MULTISPECIES: hypothetical protein [Streptomyces]|uniref:Uncharacterized protein n=1 Tax=Streptomyces olivaceiscleroticus TaxID=68245 RepID=A0ABN1A1Q3_9ACTN|nr:hypothetical protein [Streptomyces niger]
MNVGSGQWVRTRRPEDAENFLAEKRMEEERAGSFGVGGVILGVIAVLALVAWGVWAIAS